MLFSVFCYYLEQEWQKLTPSLFPDFNGDNLSFSQFGIALTKHLLFFIPNTFAYMHMYVCDYVQVDAQMYSCVCMRRLEVDVECLP